MKQRFFSLLVCTALLLSIVCSAHTAWADSSSGGGDTYTDPETGLTFVVPDGWNEQELDAEAPNFLQVQFVSQQGAGSTLLYGSVDLWNAATASERSGHTRSDFNSYYIYTLDNGAVVEYWAERFVQGAAEVQSNADVNDIQLVTYGKNEFIEYSVTQEMYGIRFPLTVVFFVENGYMHIFMFNTLGGTGGQATEDFHSVLANLQGFPTAASNLPDSGFPPAGGNTYTDPETGATFVVPEMWIERKLDEDTPVVFQVKFASQKHPGSNFLYGSADLWSTMTASERSGHTRSDIDSAYIYAYEDGALVHYMAETMVQSVEDTGGAVSLDNIALITYGNNELIEISASQDISGNRFPVTAILHVENGYMYGFIFASNSDQATQDFQSVVYSFQVPAAETPGSGHTGAAQSDGIAEMVEKHLINFLLFLLELGITFFIYALPFVVYRNVIRKRPMDEKALAIILVVLYEFVALMLLNGAMFWFLRRYANYFVPFIWGWYSYRQMMRKKDTDAVPEGAGGSAALQQPIKAEKSSMHAAHNPTAYTPTASAPTVSAVSTPTVPAAPAPQASSAAPAAPAAPAPAAYIPAVPIPAAPTPQTPSSPAAYTPTPPMQQSSPAALRIQFCRNCGFRLLEDSKFCSACGTPVVPNAKE